MNRIGFYSLDTLASQDYRKISLGIVPSTSIHFGFAFTMLHALHYMRHNPATTLEVTVTDNAYDPQMGKDFIPYNKRACGCPQHNLLEHHVGHEIRSLLYESAQFLSVDPGRTTIDFFTLRLKRDKDCSLALTSLLKKPEKARGLKKALFDDGSRPYFIPATANCSVCGHTNSHPGKVDRKKGALISTCHNESCTNCGQNSEVSLDDPSQFNLHYMIDPIRDLFVNPFGLCNRSGTSADLHIFGGDYAALHGEKRVPRVERVRNVMRLVKTEIPDIFVAPLITWKGEKVSKSTRNFFPYFGWSLEQRRAFMWAAYNQLETHSGDPVIDFN